MSAANPEDTTGTLEALHTVISVVGQWFVTYHLSPSCHHSFFTLFAEAIFCITVDGITENRLGRIAAVHQNIQTTWKFVLKVAIVLLPSSLVKVSTEYEPYGGLTRT